MNDSPDPQLAAALLKASVDSAAAEDEIVVKAQHSTAVELRKVIEAAKAGDRRAINKLQVFEVVKDPNVAARLAIMNRAQRRSYFAGLKAQRKAAKRK